MLRFLFPCLLLAAMTSAAQPSVRITLTGSNLTAAATNAVTSGGLSNNDIVDVPGDFTYEIRCLQNADCSAVGVILGSTRFTPERSTTTVNNVPNVPLLSGTIPAASISTEGSALTIVNGSSTTLFALTLRKVTRNDNGNNGNGNNNDDDDDTAPGDPCWLLTLGDIIDTNTPGAHFLVTPGGSVQDRTTDPIDEDDPVFVHVISSQEAELQMLEVTRTSATRTTGNLNIIGGGVKLADFRREAAVAATCYHRTYELGDFAPGEATVDLSMRDVAKRTSVGTLKFNVNKLYDGIMSFGPVWTNLTDRAYGLTPQGSDQIIIETENGGDNILYTAAYTYFWREKRDVEKPKPSWQQRINPTIGFSLTDPADHALAGLSLDAGQFVMTVGVHAARVTRLADGANLQVGDKFTGTTIPTEKTWQTGAFVSVTVDARAARVLIDAILP
jgi:hypothetical protein